MFQTFGLNVGMFKHLVPMMTQWGPMGLRQLSTLPIGKRSAGYMPHDHHMNENISNTGANT
jgi:hypothetical protein